MRKQPLLTINQTELLLSGLFKSPHELSVPLWDDGQNVNFSEGKVWKNRGWAAAFTSGVAVPIRGLQDQRLASGVQEFFFGTTTNLYKWNLSTVSSVGSSYTGVVDETVSALATSWSFVDWGDWVLATNGKDQGQIYKGSSFANLGGATFTTAEIFIKYATFVLALNTSNGDNMIEWCSSDAPETWTPASGNSAGNLRLRDTSGPIRAGCMLGNNIAVYTDDGLWGVQFTGAPFYFGRKKLLKSIGAVGKMAVVEEGRFNWGVSRQGIWRTDGVNYQYLDAPIRRWLQDNVNWAQASKINAYFNEIQNRVEFFFPTTTSEPTVGWAVDVDTFAWTYLAYGRTSCIPRNVFQYPMAATSAGEVFNHEFGVDADGSAQTARIRSKPLTLGSPSAWFTVDEFKVLVDDFVGTGLRLRFGTQERLDDAISWGSWITVDNSMDSFFPDFNSVSGVYLTFELESNATTDDWSFSGISLYGTGTGADVDDGNG